MHMDVRNCSVITTITTEIDDPTVEAVGFLVLMGYNTDAYEEKKDSFIIVVFQ